jgi:hypothetical protein
MAGLLEVRDDGVFQIDGAVVGSDGNAEGGVAHGRGGFKGARRELETANFAKSGWMEHRTSNVRHRTSKGRDGDRNAEARRSGRGERRKSGEEEIADGDLG